MIKVIGIHGWGGSPKSSWFPWMKKELEKKGIEVIVPEMPDTNEPKIEAWVSKLKEFDIDENTVLVGHSIGCQTILRYLENEKKIKESVLVAPWMKLDEKTIEEEGQEAIDISKPWIETPIEWGKIKQNKFVCILSDNDPFVPLEKNKRIFEDKLNSKIIVEHEKGHFDDESGIKELPSLMEEIMKII